MQLAFSVIHPVYFDDKQITFSIWGADRDVLFSKVQSVVVGQNSGFYSRVIVKYINDGGRIEKITFMLKTDSKYFFPTFLELERRIQEEEPNFRIENIEWMRAV